MIDSTRLRMINNILLNLSHIAEKYRPVFWILLLLLTTAILLFPVQLEYEYHPVQSPYIFGDNLPLFVSLYCLWMLLLLLLIFSRREAKWEKLALVCIFSIVFLGFWAIITPYFKHQDEWYNASHAQYLLDEHRLTLTHHFLGYFQFPNIHFNGAVLSSVTGIDLIPLRTLFVLFEELLLSSLTYIMFLKLLKNPTLAATGVLLLLIGNITISKVNIFHPSTFGLTLIPLFLIVLYNKASLNSAVGRLTAIIVFVAITMTHLISSLTLVLIQAAIYLVYKTKSSATLASGSLIALSIVIFLSWEIYWAQSLFGELLEFFPKMREQITLGNLFLSSETAMGSRSSPIWATAFKLFWWIFIYGFGSVIWFRYLLRFKKLNPPEQWCFGGLAGIIALTIMVTLAGQGGVQFTRFLLYASFFTVPIILMFIIGLRAYWKKLSITFIIILFAGSFPSFIVYNNMISVDRFYATEVSANEFLRSLYGKGEELDIYSSIALSPTNAYYLPKAGQVSELDSLHYEDKNELWASVTQELMYFTDWWGHSKYSVFLISDRYKGSYEHIFGFEPTDPRWQEFDNGLTKENKCYSNGHAAIYSPAAPAPPWHEIIPKN